jgi:putative hydrolase of the HAD superfamily
MQRYYYEKHGTTLRGLVDEKLAEPDAFLDFVHDIDRSGLAPNPPLAREIARLPGRKLIFTNGSRNHALRTAEQLGLADIFEDVFDIVAAELVPKPADLAYDAFFRRYGVDPASAAMFEDIAKNLAAPRALGMTTVLVTGKPGRIDHRQPHDREVAPAFVDFVTDDLSGFLARVNGELALKP